MARKTSTGYALLVLVVLSAGVDVAVAARYDSPPRASRSSRAPRASLAAIRVRT